MGFYFDPGDEEPTGDNASWRDVFALTIAVMQTLALPLAFIFGTVIGLLFVGWLFLLNPLFGLVVIALVVAAIIARGVWESRHPPKIPGLDD